MPYGSSPPNLYQPQNRVVPQLPEQAPQGFSPWQAMQNAVPSLAQVQATLGIDNMAPSQKFNNANAPQNNHALTAPVSGYFRNPR